MAKRARSVDELLAAVRDQRHDKLTPWLKADPQRAKKFWAFFESVYSEGISVSAAIRAWQDEHGPLPIGRGRLDTVIHARIRAQR